MAEMEHLGAAGWRGERRAEFKVGTGEVPV